MSQGERPRDPLGLRDENLKALLYVLVGWTGIAVLWFLEIDNVARFIGPLLAIAGWSLWIVGLWRIRQKKGPPRPGGHPGNRP